MVINLKNKNETFDKIFGKLAVKDSNDFFLGSVGSLLETVFRIETIKIETSTNSRYREEKITFDFEQN